MSVSVTNKFYMKRRKRDFREITLFTFGISTLILVAIQSVVNIIYFLFNGKYLSAESNLKFIVSSEITISILSLIIGLIYVYWYFEYKKTTSGRERKKIRY